MPPAQNQTNDPGLAPTIEFLRKYAPFDRMAPEHLQSLARRLKLGFYPKNSIVVGPADGQAARLYVIKQGRVRGEPVSEGPANYGARVLAPGECFPVDALMSRRPVHAVYRAVDDTFCFELERPQFEQLVAQSKEFHDFCSRRLANLLDQVLQEIQARIKAQASEAVSLNASVGSLVQRPPVTCRPGTPVREAVETMHRERIGSIVIVDGQQRPRGIFTLHDLLSRVARAPAGLDGRIDDFMSPDPESLPPSAFAYDAALLMTRKRFGHLCVVQDSRLIGVVSEHDLFSLQRVGLVDLSRAIDRATDVNALNRLGQDVHRLIDQMLAQGVSVEQLNQIVTQLNDHVACRVIALCLAATSGSRFAFTWLSFGSEGRREQTLKTDQDNGILFQLPAGSRADDARIALLPLAQRINDALAACGFSLCKGNIMASNPECCLSFDEWKQRFADWIDQGGPQELLNAKIFFDFRALYGDEARVSALRAWVTDAATQNRRFLRQVAESALTLQPPLGLISDFVVAGGGDRPGTLDLKLQGTAPFVDGARLLALAHRVPEVNTLARLRGVAKTGATHTDEVEAWCGAYSYIQLLRMRAHRQQARAQQPLDNCLDPDTLNELERRILKESFRQARKLQARLALDFQL